MTEGRGRGQQDRKQCPGDDQGLLNKVRKRRGYGGVHIGPWKETDMLSGDQEVVHPITCMYNFLVSTKELYYPGRADSHVNPGSFVLMGNCMGGKLPPEVGENTCE